MLGFFAATWRRN